MHLSNLQQTGKFITLILALQISSCSTNLDSPQQINQLVIPSLLQSLQQNKDNDRAEKVKEIIQKSINKYSSMNIKKLAELANNNDTKAQEAIITCCLQANIGPLLKTLVNLSKWNRIKEKAQQDDRYAYLVLRFPEQIKDPDLYKNIVERVKEHAKVGDSLAEYNLGYIYQHGLVGVKCNPKKALKWYKKAAKKGCTFSQHHLGFMYYNGKQIERDYQKALKWIKKAANGGHIIAQYMLGVIYYNGEGIKIDYIKSLKWFKKSANQGDETAQYYIGYIHEKGLGAKQDFHIAMNWYSRAAEQENSEAQYRLGYMYLNGLGVEQDLDMATYWFIQSAQQENKEAKKKLDFLTRLKGLNSDSPDFIWKEFFKDLGAIKYWDKFQTEKINLNLEELETISLAVDQPDHVLAAVLHYILCHQLPVKTFSIKGSRNKGRIKFLPACRVKDWRSIWFFFS